MTGEIQRIPVYRYIKSGKLIGIFFDGHVRGRIVIELAQDMRAITGVRNPRYLRRDATSPTKYVIEVRRLAEGQEKDRIFFSYRLIRVLTLEDLDIDKWLTTSSLDELAVSPEPDLTKEELTWAGKRDGNVEGGVALVIVVATSAALAVWGYFAGGNYEVASVLALIGGIFLARFKWKPPVPPNAARLTELEQHKKKLRQLRNSQLASAKTEFERALRNFETWKTLSGESFELAISLKLEKEGYTVKKTRYSKDGGIDIEAMDKSGQPMIVQAKKYASNVGVSVVREMVGVREGRTDKPKTLIYSLSGFTRGAKHLAKQHGIELRDIRSELLHV